MMIKTNQKISKYEWSGIEATPKCKVPSWLFPFQVVESVNASKTFF